MKTKTFKVTIRIDEENIAVKYPNFILNYENEQEFVRTWVRRIKGDGLDKLTLKVNGYDIKVTTDYEAENTLD